MDTKDAGRLGGIASAKKLSPEELRERARKAGKAPKKKRGIIQG